MFTTFLKRFTSNIFNLNFLIINLSSLIFLLIPACKKDLSPIEISKSLIFPPPGIDTTSHNFKWEIDTLEFPGTYQILPKAIWGSDTNDVWMVAHSDDWHARIWHWDGKEWNAWTESGLGVSPKDMLGFAENDIWFCGRRIGDNPVIKTIQHWNGQAWNIIEHNIEVHIMSLWGLSSQNMYFGLIDGRIAHYNGVNFTINNTGTSAQILDLHGINETKIYAVGIESDTIQPFDSTKYYIFRYNDSKWNVNNYFLQTITSPYSNLPVNGLWSDEDELFLLGVNGSGIFGYNGHNWYLIFKQERSPYRLHGSDINNIFTAGYSGTSIYHFNGSNWNNFEELKPLNFIGSGLYTFTNHVFIAGYANNKAYVIRGRRWLN